MNVDDEGARAAKIAQLVRAKSLARSEAQAPDMLMFRQGATLARVFGPPLNPDPPASEGDRAPPLQRGVAAREAERCEWYI